ncbi:MAG: aromatic compound degradation protein PaaI [Subtercola sp.]|nr:aromatic compound degradation protein PaaI [Subtercola sp.]
MSNATQADTSRSDVGRPEVGRSDMSRSGATAMIGRDRASAALGMSVVTGEPGHAVVTMAIRDDMLNGFDVMHGGLIFAIADTAFAIACNESDSVTLAAGAEISFLRPVRAGQVLTATAERRTLSGRSGIYDVQVTDETGVVVAEFRGRSRTTSLPVPAR